MECTLYIFSKKENSTAIPSDSTRHETFNIQLKEPSSILNPTIILSGAHISYNYAYIPQYTRYYFVTEQTILTGERTQLTLACDELASWRNAIQNYAAFIERSSNAALYNTQIIDPYLSTKQKVTYSAETSSQLSGGFDTTTGFYVLRTIGSGSVQSLTGITSYCLTGAQLISVFSYMFTSDNFSDVLNDEVVKTFFNPFQYVVDLKWIPFDYTTFTATLINQDTVRFGWWDSGVTAYVIDASFAGVRFYCPQITLPSNPYTDFRAFDDRFSSYSLYLPALGIVHPGALAVQNGLCCTYELDITTGMCEIHLYTGALTDSGSTQSGSLIASYKTQISVPIQLGQITEGTAATAVKGIAGTISAGLRGDVAGIIDSVSSISQPDADMTGSQGERYILYRNNTIKMMLDTFDSCSFPTQWAGRPAFTGPIPLGQVLQQFGGGYVKCGGASVLLAGLQPEIDAVNNYLNTGFYLE